MKIIVVWILFVFTFSESIGQTCTGKVLDAETQLPIEYVSIGIIGKDIGTVSDSEGNYSIRPGELSDPDSIRFSCVGYEPFTLNLNALKEEPQRTVLLKPKTLLLDEVVVLPSVFKEKILGNKYAGTMIQGGFSDNKMGYECGVLLKIKKRALLEKFRCNIANCSYDSIFFRINVYKQLGENTFENILDRPIYVYQGINEEKTSIEIDLSFYNLLVSGNTLVTMEHIVDLGEGSLFFSGGLLKGAPCYSRKTSEGNWSKIPIKLGFNVTAQVEQ